MSSRSGLVESSATGASINSSIRRTYFIACAGRSAQERAPAVVPLPTLDRLVDGLDPRLRRLARWQPVDPLAIELVVGADVDRLESVEDVELGQRDAVDARRLDRLAHQHRVEPAAAPPPARVDPVLVAAIADPLADLVVLARSGTGRRRPASCRPWRCRARSRSPSAPARSRWPRSRPPCSTRSRRIGAVVDVEQRALRALEQNALAGAAQRLEPLEGRRHERQDLRRDAQAARRGSPAP